MIDDSNVESVALLLLPPDLCQFQAVSEPRLQLTACLLRRGHRVGKFAEYPEPDAGSNSRESMPEAEGVIVFGSESSTIRADVAILTRHFGFDVAGVDPLSLREKGDDASVTNSAPIQVVGTIDSFTELSRNAKWVVALRADPTLQECGIDHG